MRNPALAATCLVMTYSLLLFAERKIDGKTVDLQESVPPSEHAIYDSMSLEGAWEMSYRLRETPSNKNVSRRSLLHTNWHWQSF